MPRRTHLWASNRGTEWKGNVCRRETVCGRYEPDLYVTGRMEDVDCLHCIECARIEAERPGKPWA